MEYGSDNMGSFSSGVSAYSTKSTSSSHIKPNESGGGGAKKSTNRPYAGKGTYETGMKKGAKNASTTGCGC